MHLLQEEDLDKHIKGSEWNEKKNYIQIGLFFGLYSISCTLISGANPLSFKITFVYLKLDVSNKMYKFFWISNTPEHTEGVRTFRLFTTWCLFWQQLLLELDYNTLLSTYLNFVQLWFKYFLELWRWGEGRNYNVQVFIDT